MIFFNLCVFGVVLFETFPMFPEFSPIFSGIVRIGPFPPSRPVKAPMRNSPERVRDTIRTFPEKVGNLPVWKPPGSASLKSADRKGASGKGPRQKASKIDIFRAWQKKVKNCQKVSKIFSHFSTVFARHQFSGPFWGGAYNSRSSRNF